MVIIKPIKLSENTQYRENSSNSWTSPCDQTLTCFIAACSLVFVIDNTSLLSSFLEKKDQSCIKNVFSQQLMYSC